VAQECEWWSIYVIMRTHEKTSGGPVSRDGMRNFANVVYL
jgi:hypothetical protein